MLNPYKQVCLCTLNIRFMNVVVVVCFLINIQSESKLHILGGVLMSFILVTRL